MKEINTLNDLMKELHAYAKHVELENKERVASHDPSCYIIPEAVTFSGFLKYLTRDESK